MMVPGAARASGTRTKAPGGGLQTAAIAKPTKPVRGDRTPPRPGLQDDRVPPPAYTRRALLRQGSNLHRTDPYPVHGSTRTKTGQGTLIWMIPLSFSASAVGLGQVSLAADITRRFGDRSRACMTVRHDGKSRGYQVEPHHALKTMRGCLVKPRCCAMVEWWSHEAHSTPQPGRPGPSACTKGSDFT
jgi:hypothetical protein